MSRPRKMHKPLKGNFTDIINAVADGRGVKVQAKDKALRKNLIQASESPPKHGRPIQGKE